MLTVWPVQQKVQNFGVCFTVLHIADAGSFAAHVLEDAGNHFLQLLQDLCKSWYDSLPVLGREGSAFVKSQLTYHAFLQQFHATTRSPSHALHFLAKHTSVFASADKHLAWTKPKNEPVLV